MSGITPLKFTGVSTFSQDFQSILSRAVSIASLPVQQMQNQQTTILAKKQTLASIEASVADLKTAVGNLARVGDTSALTVSSSNPNRVSVTNNGLTSAATYTITDITSVAKAASETTATGLATANATAVDGDGHLELVLGGETFNLDISAHNNLNGLAAAINESGAGVTATVLNTGSVANPFFLSITAESTGATTLQLRDTVGDSGSNLLTSANQGTNAIFKLNGLAVSKPDNVISDVVPNVTFTIQSESALNERVNITAASNRSSLSSALQGFVAAYNGLAEARNSQVGKTAGILSGDTVIQQVSQALRKVAGFSSSDSGAIRSLADLGIELDRNGRMSFDTLKFSSLGSLAVNDAYHFFRSAEGGFGALTASLDTLSNPFTGMIRSQQDQYDAADKRLTVQIETLAERINRMQSSLELKLQQADSLLSGLQGQQKLIEASFASANLALFGKQNN
jgi:flagellar hook-associated protein 2